MFSENNLDKDYSSISKHELRSRVCNNERDFDESLRGFAEYYIYDYINRRRTMMPHLLVNISRIKKFRDLCNEDIVGRHFPITNVIYEFHSFRYMLNVIADNVEISINFEKYSLPIFIILGLLGNCLSVIVLFRKTMRSTSSNIYLGMLATSDIVCSMMLLIEWLLLTNKNPRENYYLYWLYFFKEFPDFFFKFLSVWLIVAFTIERYIVTKYPLLRRSWCTVKRAKIVVIMLMGLAILYTILHVFFIFGTKYYVDEVFFKKNMNFYDVLKQLELDNQIGASQRRRIMDSIIIFTLPALVIVICNTLIGYSIYQQNRVRKMLITASDSSNERTRISSDKMLQHKITRMLILVSSIFVILKLPAHYIVSYMPKYVNSLVKLSIIELLDRAHYSINFVLYCATGQTFRREIIRMFTKRTNL